MSEIIGNVFLVVAPSGAGKSSLVNALLERDSDLSLSVSCTTRAPRSSEIEGRDYRFVSLETFNQLRDQQQLLEWAEVHGNFYATPRDSIEQAIHLGKDVLLEIDWQGARQVRQYLPTVTGVFIMPPSIGVLEQRLRSRGQDSNDVIERRIHAAHSEIEHANEFEYVIINQDFSLALQQLQAIISVARLTFKAQKARHHELFSGYGLN
ncbi:MAG: guanylate kinase [Burkholderiaceae bacterium]|nr:guanylate kinase [Burkholderiaceae bacterium]